MNRALVLTLAFGACAPAPPRSSIDAAYAIKESPWTLRAGLLAKAPMPPALHAIHLNGYQPNQNDVELFTIEQWLDGVRSRRAGCALVLLSLAWCDPTRAELRGVTAAAQALAAQGVEVIDVLVEGAYGERASLADLDRWRQEMQPPFTVAIDHPAENSWTVRDDVWRPPLDRAIVLDVTENRVIDLLAGHDLRAEEILYAVRNCGWRQE